MEEYPNVNVTFAGEGPYENYIKENENLNITFSNIPIDDKKTLEIFKEVKTDGIFQFESPGMRRFLKKLQVSSFNDVIAALALYRPGAMDFIDNYIRRKNNQLKHNFIKVRLCFIF